jgi:predicted TIM-barrel fold metal-dependent hydrolase
MDQLPEKNNEATTGKKLPIINCHAHIFTGDHVPAHLGKTVIRSPFYKLLNFHWIFSAFRWWYSKGPGKTKHGGIANKKATFWYTIKMFLKRSFILSTFLALLGFFLTLQAADFLFHWIFPDAGKATGWIMEQVNKLHNFLAKYNILLEIKDIGWQIVLILAVVIFFRSGRNFLILILKNSFSILKKLPGKETGALIKRYLTIGRFTFHKNQGRTLGDLEKQYPNDSGFVILPMDMEYMEAGKVKEPYRVQMEKLAALKKNNHIYPFVFVDPRRIAAEPDYFNYRCENGKVILEDGCFIKEYIEDKKFSGFKIYPALGYYPFDPLLLPLWKYAEQKQLPILTHCVRGPMYYRGRKKAEWDFHPIFKQTVGEGKYDPLLLSQSKNDGFSANFTHPLNFLCLLQKEWLKKAVNQAYKKTKDERLKEVFGLTPSDDDEKATLRNGLADLKICLGHYGGDDEWKRYFEQDRYDLSNELSQNPYWGIDFFHLKNSNEPSPGKPEQLWKFTDWYSIISSMMLQYRNVYADISFILHNDSLILPLLKQTLQNHELRKKVLYGTDFYVVRNLKSDKQMLADMMGGLDEKDFDQVARTNPALFLKNFVQ